MLPAEHMHFMSDSAVAVNMLIDSVVTPLVTQSEQAIQHAITGERQVDGRLAEDQHLARCSVGIGHVKPNSQRYNHLRQASPN